MFDFVYREYRQNYVNPYKLGVKIDNYNEELFGKELEEKALNNKQKKQNHFLSESQDKFKWPNKNESNKRCPKYNKMYDDYVKQLKHKKDYQRLRSYKKIMGAPQGLKTIYHNKNKEDNKIYATVYDLTMNRKEKTQKIFEPHYVLKENFNIYPYK